MSITKEAKSELVKEYGVGEADTGSTEVQVAILTSRIRTLTEHLKRHKKDNGARRGLLRLVGRRSALLKYYKSRNYGRYVVLVDGLGIRRK